MGSEAMRAALSRYQAGEARILISCRALDEGLDVPETDVGIAKPKLYKSIRKLIAA